MQNRKPKLFEGLRASDLKNMVEHRITIDQYKSKMGNDEDIVVVSFRVKDKFPAIDLMDFIEKGYPSVLDSDMSTGEEKDGQYAVFVEFQRNDKFPKELANVLSGVKRLCDCEAWHFKYFKDVDGHDFTEEAVAQFVPLSKEAYLARVKEQKVSDVSDVLDLGPAEVVDVDESNNIKLSKPYSGDLSLHLEALGFYDELQESLQGGIQLDESSTHQVSFLEKYLGNYEIHKINNKFLIKNKDKAMIVSKESW